MQVCVCVRVFEFELEWVNESALGQQVCLFWANRTWRLRSAIAHLPHYSQTTKTIQNLIYYFIRIVVVFRFSLSMVSGLSARVCAFRCDGVPLCVCEVAKMPSGFVSLTLTSPIPLIFQPHIHVALKTIDNGTTINFSITAHLEYIHHLSNVKVFETKTRYTPFTSLTDKMYEIMKL